LPVLPFKGLRLYELRSKHHKPQYCYGQLEQEDESIVCLQVIALVKTSCESEMSYIMYG